MSISADPRRRRFEASVRQAAVAQVLKFGRTQDDVRTEFGCSLRQLQRWIKAARQGEERVVARRGRRTRWGEEIVPGVPIVRWGVHSAPVGWKPRATPIQKPPAPLEPLPWGVAGTTTPALEPLADQETPTAPLEPLSEGAAASEFQPLYDQAAANAVDDLEATFSSGDQSGEQATPAMEFSEPTATSSPTWEHVHEEPVPFFTASPEITSAPSLQDSSLLRLRASRGFRRNGLALVAGFAASLALGLAGYEMASMGNFHQTILVPNGANVGGTLHVANIEGNGAGLMKLTAASLTGTVPDRVLGPGVTQQGNDFNSAMELLKLDPLGLVPTSNLPPAATLGGNTFDGANQLLQLTGSGLVPAGNLAGSYPGLTITNANLPSGTYTDITGVGILSSLAISAPNVSTLPLAISSPADSTVDQLQVNAGSASTGNLINLEVGGASKFAVNASGNISELGGSPVTGQTATTACTASSGQAVTGVTTTGGIVTVSPTCTALTVLVGNLSGVLPVGNGGTGASAVPTNGQLLIGNGTNFTVAALGVTGLTATTGSGSLSLAVIYGSAANTAVQGNQTVVCPSGSGNLAGAGNTITLGSGGTCNPLSTVTNPSFSGLISGSAAGQGLALTGAPAAVATQSLVQIGSPIAGGNNTAGTGGTYFGLNAASAGAGSTADFINFQNNGTPKLVVDSSGTIAKVGGTVTSGTFSCGGGTVVSGLTLVGGVVTGSSCGAPSAGSVVLNAINAAGSSNTIANGDFNQTWQWALTTASNVGMTFTESSASAATGTPSVVGIGNLASSTATPLTVTDNSTLVPGVKINGPNAAGSDLLQINAGASYTGNLVNLKVGGASKFAVNQAGNISELGGSAVTGQTATTACTASSGQAVTGVTTTGGIVTTSPTCTALTVLVGNLSGVLPVGNGGTGSSTVPTNGQLLIGNGTNYTVAALGVTGLTATTGSGSLSLAVNYGSGANTAVQGNVTLTCPSGTGNLNGGGTVITLGSGGSCAALNTITNPSFSGLVTASGGMSVTGATTHASGGVAVIPLAITSPASSTADQLQVNAGNLFSGNLINLEVNGLSKFAVNQAGNISELGGSAVTGQSATTSCNTGIGQAVTGVTTTGGLVTTSPTCAALTIPVGNVSGVLPVGNGGTGTSAVPTNGQLPIGNGSSYAAASLGATGLTATTGSGSLSLAVIYGSAANTAVQGNVTLTCPSGTGNLNGGGTVITLGSGGSCAALNTVTNPTFSGLVTGNGGLKVTNASATAFTVAASGTNYGFQVDESTASAATGILIKSAAATGGVRVSALSSAADETLQIDAKGAGVIYIGTNSTGTISIGTTAVTQTTYIGNTTGGTLGLRAYNAANMIFSVGTINYNFPTVNSGAQTIAVEPQYCAWTPTDTGLLPTGTMVGGGGASCTATTGSITPQVTGRVYIIITGSIHNTASPAGVSMDPILYYGTGTAPASGAAITGTACSRPNNDIASTGVGYGSAFAIQCVATLTKGTAYWIDVGIVAGGGAWSWTQAVNAVAYEF